MNGTIVSAIYSCVCYVSLQSMEYEKLLTVCEEEWNLFIVNSYDDETLL